MSDETEGSDKNLSSALALRDALRSALLLGFETQAWSDVDAFAHAKAAFVGGTEVLSLTNAISNASPNVGDQVTFTITVTNNGTGTYGATVNNALPSGLTYVSSTDTGGTYNSSTGNWVISSINANGGTQTLTITATVNSPYEKTDTATITKEAQTDTGPGPSTASASETPVCYVSGTLIRTARGGSIVDVAVEDLAVGGLAVTPSGAHRPIKWIGHRRTDCRNHPTPREAMPIRIAAHALGANKPARDLYVSPGHAICINVVDEVLIPASSLVNGSTIRQVAVDEVTYWHVELDSHDLLLAENLASESYLDMGNRGFFRESDVVGLDALPDAPLVTRTHADFCRPFHSDGPLVDIVRSQIRARGTMLGWTLEHEPMADLHLIADGKRIEPVVRDLAARFIVPAGAKDVWLVSNTSRPSDISDSVDIRDLGLYLSGLAIDDGFGTSRTIALDDPLLCVGFHEMEHGGRRWTAGRARLPAALWEDCSDGFFLRMECARPALPCWEAPQAAEAIRLVQAA